MIITFLTTKAFVLNRSIDSIVFLKLDSATRQSFALTATRAS